MLMFIKIMPFGGEKQAVPVIVTVGEMELVTRAYSRCPWQCDMNEPSSISHCGKESILPVQSRLPDHNHMPS